jgi:hypothetical protein
LKILFNFYKLEMSDGEESGKDFEKESQEEAECKILR